MAESFTMFHEVGEAQTTQAAYDSIWFPKGWRKSPKTSTAPAAEEHTTNQADQTAEED